MALPEENSSSSGQGIGPALAEFTRAMAVELAGQAPELPSFPEVALRVRRALARDDIGVDEVVRIVSAEPSLAVRLLQLANSVAMNPGAQRITTLRTAIARVGFNMARSATVAFAMSQMRRAEAWRGLSARFRKIWENNARLAATSYALARHCGRHDADEALMAGMLNSLGKLFVLTRVSRFPALLADPSISGEIENVWQARAGRALLYRWELGEEVLAAACEFERAQERVERPATLSDVLLAARCLVDDLGLPAELRGEGFLASAPFARLGLDATAAARVVESSAAEIASLRAALAD
jgi:HD-like signal output (HDOD) protein